MLKNWASGSVRRESFHVAPRSYEHREALVVHVDQVARVVGVDPQAVVIAARRLQPLERLAAVVRHAQAEAHRVDGVRVARVDADLPEHPAVRVRVALHERLLLRREAAHLRPRRALVVRAVDGRALDEPRRGQAVRIGLLLLGRLARELVVVHEGVHHVRRRAADIQADASPELRLGQPLVDGYPRRAPVGGLVDAAAGVVREVARVVPLEPDALPGGRVQRVRIGGIHHEVDGAGPVVDEQHSRPRPAAVGGLVHTPLGVVGPLVARRRDEHDVGVGRVDQDAGNRVRVGEPHVLPGLPGIRRLVDARAGLRAAEDVRLAGADPHDVRVRRRDRHVADRRRRPLLEHRLPGCRFVLGLPQAARRGGDIDGVGLAARRRDRDVNGPAADVPRPEELPSEVLEGRGLLHRLVLVESLQAQRGIGGRDALGRGGRALRRGPRGLGAQPHRRASRVMSTARLRWRASRRMCVSVRARVMRHPPVTGLRSAYRIALPEPRVPSPESRLESPP